MQKPYYEKPKFKLYQANCLELLAELPENSVDMVFCRSTLQSLERRYFSPRWTDG